MVRRVTKRRLIESLIEAQVPTIRNAFMEVFDDIANSVQIDFLIDALRRGQIEEALAVVQMSSAMFTKYVRSIDNAYQSSGELVAAQADGLRDPITGAKLIVRFDGRNEAAERFLKEISSTKIVKITTDQRDMIRNALTDGMMRGDNPRTVALDLVGRVDDTGRRSGGLLGLTDQQSQFVRNARRELMSGDPDQLKNYLTRKLRNRSYDKFVRAALRDGKPIDPKWITAMTQSYSNRLLKLRGDTIARTEAMQAFSQAQFNQLQDLISQGLLRPTDVKMVWRTAGDARVRDSHGTMNGQVRNFGEDFVSGDGNRLRYPRDPLAPASETINCRCIVQQEVDYFAALEVE
jgi:hypothetical protein